jgi:hypothetical protein
VRVTRVAGGGRVGFEAERFVWGVCLDLAGETPLADNFFDLYPGVPHEVEWHGDADPIILRVGNL